jgi:DNA-binding helix-hairpin-helix protein with protein kinase domain
VTSAGSCPWCAIESVSGTLLFLAPLGALVPDSQFNLAVVWSRIAQIPTPGAVAAIAVPAAIPSPKARTLQSSRRQAKFGGRLVVVIAGLLALALAPEGGFFWFLLAIGLWYGIGSWAGSKKEVAEFRRKREEAGNLLTQLEQRLRTETGRRVSLNA